MYCYFIGIIISESDLNEYELKEEFQTRIVSYRKIGSDYCLYYKDKCLETRELTPDNAKKIALTPTEMQSFINNLKRVRSEKIYNSYPDNFGLKKVTLKTKIAIKQKIRIC